jgi:hypothetical protein
VGETETFKFDFRLCEGPLLLTCYPPLYSSMSSNNHKRSASPSGDRDASLNKRQKRDDDDEKKEEKEEKKNQLDEKEEKKEREVKEDITAAALPVSDPDLVVGTVDRDLICAICFSLLSKPTGSFTSLPSFPPHTSCRFNLVVSFRF